MTPTGSVSFERAHTLRPVVIAGIAVIAVFFVGIGGWAATAPLRGAAIAPATVAPEGHRKTIQHLEGGIVREILVREGSTVDAGTVLLRLDDTQARAEAAEIEARWYARRAALGRLQAEQAGAAEPLVDPGLAGSADPAAAAALHAEAQQMRMRREALASQIAVLQRRAAKERETIKGLESSIQGYLRQAELIEEEIRTVEDLLKKGLERKPRLLALQRQRVELQRTVATSRSEIARAQEAIAEAEQEITSLREDRAAEIAAELAQTRTEVAELGEKLKALHDRLERKEVRAPQAGTVVDLRVKTLGGVVGPGEPILDLVPANDRLVLEARVTPNDIDEVGVGLTAQVYLLAYRTRHLPRVDGVVEHVSADRLVDPQTHEAYYAARIAVDRDQLATLGTNVVLTPGMPAEALIMTRERTILDYLLAPVTDVLRRGMREA